MFDAVEILGFAVQNSQLVVSHFQECQKHLAFYLKSVKALNTLFSDYVAALLN